MASPLAHVDAARRIVHIQRILYTAPHLPLRDRAQLVAEQRYIWEAVFPNVAYEQIAGSVH